MDIAVLSDIHGNFEAFQTCIRYALKRNIERFIFLGDYVGEFGFPQKTMELIFQLKKKYSCIFIKGNKEDYWLNHVENAEIEWKKYDSTTGSLYYTLQNLTTKDLNFFSSLDITKEICFPGMEQITICHGSPLSNKENLLPNNEKTFEIMEQSKSKLIICGHTHIQRTIAHKNKKIINPGSVGTPQYSEGRTQFLILHAIEKKWKEEYVNLTYDVEKEIESLYAAKLHQIAPFWCKTTIQVIRTGIYPHSLVLEKAMDYCKEEQGSCNWPKIPEKYWKKAFEEVFEHGNM